MKSTEVSSSGFTNFKAMYVGALNRPPFLQIFGVNSRLVAEVGVPIITLSGSTKADEG